MYLVIRKNEKLSSRLKKSSPCKNLLELLKFNEMETQEILEIIQKTKKKG